MTDLPRGSACAAPDPSVDHDPGSDAGPEIQVGHGTGDSAQHRSAEGRGLHVVLHAERDSESEFGPDGEVQGLHAEVDRVVDTAGLGVYEAGDADPDGADVDKGEPVLLRECLHGRDDALDDRVIAPTRRSAQASADGPGGVHGHRVDLRAADVQAHSNRPTGAVGSARTRHRMLLPAVPSTVQMTFTTLPAVPRAP